MFLITDFNIGGTEKILFELVRKIDREKFCPVVCFLKKGGYYSNKLNDIGVKYYKLDLNRYGILFFPLMLIYTIFKICILIKKEKIDIIHTWLFQGNITGRIAAMLIKFERVVSSIRGMETDIEFYIEKIFNFNIKKLVVNSNSLKLLVKEKIKIDSSKIELIYNGIDLSNLPICDGEKKRYELGIRNNVILVGTVGRLHKEKGIDYLIDSIKILENDKRIMCIIAGDGPERRKLERKIKLYNMSDRIFLLGTRYDSYEIISALDIFVLSSPYEGMPNVVLEAMALRKKIVVTGTGGTSELIENYRNGIVVGGNIPFEIAEAIIYIINNPENADIMAKNAMEDVKKYNIHEMINKYEELYRKVMYGKFF